MTQQTATRVTGVLNVAIPVRDHERVLNFYCGTLGMETRREATFGPGLRWVEVAPAGATTTIALAPLPEGKSGAVDTGVRLGTADVESAHAELRSQGVDVDEMLRVPGVPLMFSLRDPEGNTLYIVETA
jgi:predicted enzyme related to lactoylglutathione lyase